MKSFLLLTVLLNLSLSARATTHDRSPAPRFKKVFIIVLENTGLSEANKTAYLAKTLGPLGATFSNFHGEGHPSQGNYIAMTAGSTLGVSGDGSVNLNAQHIGNLLEAKGMTWKAYAEGYPGSCFTGGSKGKYARKHVPFISYTNVSKNAQECAKIVNSSQLALDVKNGTLPDYSFYVPDLNNDGHDTSVAFASDWLNKNFSGYLKDPNFMKDMLFVVTFDEDDGTDVNSIFTLFYGPSVKPNVVESSRYDHYSLLRTIEDEWGLGTLGLLDAKAAPITAIFN